MTPRGSTRVRRVETDCCQTNPSVAGCNPKHSTQANDGSVLKTPSVSPQRRQSPRLKAINAIYKAQDAISSKVQQTSGGDSPCNADQIKVESIESPDDPNINETLKDLRKKCKSKKQRDLKSVASSTTGFDHALVKPKEEEPDLEEPLICLKSKLSNKSSTLRKRRKHAHFSQSALQIEEAAKTPYPSFSREQGSSPVATNRSSISMEVADKDKSNSITERVDENLETTSVKDPLHRFSPELAYTVKCEIIETCNNSSSVFTDNFNALGCSPTKLPQKICEEESAYGCSTRKFLHPCVISHAEIASHNSSPSRVSQMGASLLVDISQSVTEIDSVGSKSVAYVSASSDLDFIEKFNDPSNSSSDLHEKIDTGDLEHGDVTSFTTESLDCCTNEVSSEFMETESNIDLPESNEELLDCGVNEVSIEFMEPDNYTSLPESGKGGCEENTELDSSERSIHKLPPSNSKSEMLTLNAEYSQFVTATMDLSSDVSDRVRNFNVTLEEGIHDGTMTQMDNVARTDNQECVYENNSIEFRMSKEFENQGDEILVPETPKCIHENNVTTRSLPSRDIHDVHHASSFCEEVGSLNRLVLKALCGDARRNSNGDCVNSHIEKSSLLGKYDLHVPRHSNTSFGSCDLHDATVSSLEAESLHCYNMGPMLISYTEQAAGSTEIDAEELFNSQIEKSSLIGMDDPCIPQHSDTSFSSAQDSHGVDECSPGTEDSHCPTMDQMLNSRTEKTLDCHSPQVFPADSSAVNGLLNVEDSSSKASRNIQSSKENMVYVPVDMPTCLSPEKSNLVEGEGSSMDNELTCDQSMKVERPPKKLLSNRKVLSPTSQEKLRRALNVNELDDMMKAAYHEEAEVMLNSEGMTKQSKGSRKGSPQQLSKGILKSQDTFERDCSCTKNSLIHTQAQKAVIFSQRQMQDIESIATKLLKGLTSMKNIVAESTASEACASASSKFSPEEIRMAIDNASNLETTTKKWLSMMAKDCNRFCKIMNSTQNRAAAPVGVRKQPKKITFADEAGGLLCHVKVFEQLPASFIVPRSED